MIKDFKKIIDREESVIQIKKSSQTGICKDR